ncbi:aspartate phosphatase [Bacillus gobiensis]|uniref:response regulator aspartate phosphatase n=1 Tax=Bacillus gobiensis TaxID=1441095 RepID=UPI003D1BA337
MKVGSYEVELRMNDWYNAIRKYDIKEAKAIQSEIKKRIKNIEDRDTQTYYKIMNFRHQMLLNYLEPSIEGMVQLENMKEIDELNPNEDNVDGMIDYYFNFFRGMHEFKNREYLRAILFYKRAEKRLDQLFDEIERAEFNYKIAAAYYNMKQTQLSMLYAKQAYDTFKAVDGYAVRLIHCEFVIAGNYDDASSHEKALPHLENAFRLAKLEKKPRLVAAALFNLANCYLKMGDINNAEIHSRQSVEEYLSGGYETTRPIVEAVFLLTRALVKHGKTEEAKPYFKEGFSKARLIGDYILSAKFKFLKDLYADDGDREEILKSFDALESKEMYPDMENLALEAATYYNERGLYENSAFFYRKMLDIQKIIGRGGINFEV